jgi:hypothetical protein
VEVLLKRPIETDGYVVTAAYVLCPLTEFYKKTSALHVEKNALNGKRDSSDMKKGIRDRRLAVIDKRIDYNSYTYTILLTHFHVQKRKYQSEM